MKFWLLFLLGLPFAARGGAPEASGPATVLGPLPAGASAWERTVRVDGRDVQVRGVSFSSRESTLVVLDNPPADRKSLPDALAAAGASAGCNGGYFHPDFTPLGLVVSQSQPVHAFERAKLLSGIISARKGGLFLTRAGDFRPGADVRDALQAGPWLVEQGVPVSGLNAERLARRTIVATNGGGRWALIVISPVSLAQAARLLTVNDLPGGWTITDALNLDGGSSTALFAGPRGHPLIDIPSYGPVRNYLAIVPRRR